MRDLGDVENRNFAIESRSAEGHLERLPELAAELVRLKVDVLVTDATPPTLAGISSTRARSARRASSRSSSRPRPASTGCAGAWDPLIARS
jgi:hypothetical protein